jgi:predicted Zn-dependent peptidase
MIIRSFNLLVLIKRLSAFLAHFETPLDFPANLYRHANGLAVIHQQVHTSPSVVVDVWVKAGAIAEPEPWFGMAHFLEHMIFKGTDYLPAGCFDQVVEGCGGVTNAATSHDYAHFYIHTASDYVAETLPYLAELLLHAAIPADEFDREREVVLEEIRQAEDDPDWLGFQTLLQATYQHHPYGRSILGNADQMMQRSPREMLCFHRAHYQPENMTVVVVGNISQDQTLQLVEQHFSQFAPRSICPQPVIQPAAALEGIQRQELCLPHLQQTRLMMAWLVPGVKHLRSAYGLDLIAVLLGGGRSSRLVRELREERQLVQAVDCNFSLQQEASLFTITAWLDSDQIDRVEALIGDRLAQLAITPVSELELVRSKRLLCNDYAFSTETAGQLAGLYGYYNTIAEAALAVAYPHQIQSFQAEELQLLAGLYLSPCNYAVSILKPC